MLILVLPSYLIFLQTLKIGRGYKMSKMSRDKGKRGEREVATIIRSHGFEARRGQQHRGGSDSPDVIHNIPNVFIEVKFREQLNVYTTLSQAEKEAGGKIPAVFHRRKRTGWVVTVGADDFLSIMEVVRELDELKQMEEEYRRG